MELRLASVLDLFVIASVMNTDMGYFLDREQLSNWTRAVPLTLLTISVVSSVLIRTMFRANYGGSVETPLHSSHQKDFYLFENRIFSLRLC